jgi:hypothetical protein
MLKWAANQKGLDIDTQKVWEPLLFIGSLIVETYVIIFQCHDCGCWCVQLWCFCFDNILLFGHSDLQLIIKYIYWLVVRHLRFSHRKNSFQIWFGQYYIIKCMSLSKYYYHLRINFLCMIVYKVSLIHSEIWHRSGWYCSYIRYIFIPFIFNHCTAVVFVLNPDRLFPWNNSAIVLYRLSTCFKNRGSGCFTPLSKNISVILWWSGLLVEETGVPGENNRPPASH